MTAASSSNPPSSPRLPSPPPFTENQIEPSHPTLSSEPIITSPLRQNNKSGTTTNGSLFSHSKSSSAASSVNSTANPVSFTTNNKYATVRRIRPGTKSAEISTGPPLVPLNELDSAFQLQEHLASLLASRTNKPASVINGARSHSDDPESTTDHTVPLSRLDCETISSPPDGVDPKLWCYELTRRLTRDLNILVVALIHDECTSKSCPEMRAGEWQYLCAAHDQPQPCCAIEYITHTLDHAAMVLCSTKYFPSRLSLTTSGSKQLSSIFRRLYRIFAHAWFQHRRVFWTVELEYGLYLFFKTASERYALIPEDTLTIPKEAEDVDGMLAEQKALQDAYIRGRSNPNGRELQDFGSFGGEDDSDSDDSDDLDVAEDQHEEGDLGNGTPEHENPFDDDSSSIDDSSEDDEPAQPELNAENMDAKNGQDNKEEEGGPAEVENKEEDIASKEAEDDLPKLVEAENEQVEEGATAEEEQKEPEVIKTEAGPFFEEGEDPDEKFEVEELLDSFLENIDKDETEKNVEQQPTEEKKKVDLVILDSIKKDETPSEPQPSAEPTVDAKEETNTETENVDIAAVEKNEDENTKPEVSEKKEEEKEPEEKQQ